MSARIYHLSSNIFLPEALSTFLQLIESKLPATRLLYPTARTHCRNLSPSSEQHGESQTGPYMGAKIPSNSCTIVSTRLLRGGRHDARDVSSFSTPPSRYGCSPPLRRVLSLLSHRHVAWSGAGECEPRRQSHHAAQCAGQAHEAAHNVSHALRAHQRVEGQDDTCWSAGVHCRGGQDLSPILGTEVYSEHTPLLETDKTHHR